MIKQPSFFAYTDEQWSDIRTIMRDALGRDADVPDLGAPLRASIALAASRYHFHNAKTRQRPRRVDLNALRKDAVNLRASIYRVMRSPFTSPPNMLPAGCGAAASWPGMLTATIDYFGKLLHNIDRQIAQAGSPHDNARKTARAQCWTELLSIWCELGGKPDGAAAARFLFAASAPVIGSAVKEQTVAKWLQRRQRKTVSKVAKPVKRRRAA